MSANAVQVGGAHYRATFQHWDVIDDNGIGYLEGCATKYLTRVKNGLEDVLKAGHYIDKLAEKAAVPGGRYPTGHATATDIAAFLDANGVRGHRAEAITLLLGPWTQADLYRARACVDLIEAEEAPVPVARHTADVLPFRRPGSTQPEAKSQPAGISQRDIALADLRVMGTGADRRSAKAIDEARDAINHEISERFIEEVRAIREPVGEPRRDVMRLEGDGEGGVRAVRLRAFDSTSSAVAAPLPLKA